VPPALNTITASGVTAPNSSVPGSIPSASGVTPPNSGVPSVPSSSGVTPPSSSGGTASGVTPPSSGGTVTPQGYYNASGKCVESSAFDECQTTRDLEQEAAKLAAKAAAQQASDAERLRQAEIEAQLALRKKLGNDQYADDAMTALKNSDIVLGGLDNKGKRQYGLNPQQQTNFFSELAKGLNSNAIKAEDVPGLIWFAQNHVVQWDSSGKPYYFRWNPRIGQDVPMVMDLPGGSPFFVNGDPNELNSKMNGVTAGFFQSVFGGMSPTAFRANALSGASRGSSFVRSGCRHPNMNRPTGNMPPSNPKTGIDPKTGKPYSFVINGDIDTNIKIAEQHAPLTRGIAFVANTLNWFNDMWAPNRPWDMKNWGPGSGGFPEFENYGNFMYGATGRAAGISFYTLEAAAGWGQTTPGQGTGVSRDWFGKGLVGASEASGSKIPGLNGALGDDPRDVFWVASGADYYDFKCYQ
jgi:hypothetical protein